MRLAAHVNVNEDDVSIVFSTVREGDEVTSEEKMAVIRTIKRMQSDPDVPRAKARMLH